MIRHGIDIFSDAAERLARSEAVHAFESKMAQAAAEAASALAPRKSGETAESYVAIAREGEAALASTSRVWHIVEFGSINNPAYRPMTRAVEQLGMRFEPK